MHAYLPTNQPTHIPTYLPKSLPLGQVQRHKSQPQLMKESNTIIEGTKYWDTEKYIEGLQFNQATGNCRHISGR